MTFIALFKLSFLLLTCEDMADFVMWRSAVDVPGVPPPPRGNPVLPSTAMAELAHIRAHAQTTSTLPEHVLYGYPITSVLKRLGAGERHDSVRKTPVPADTVVRLATAATAAGTAVSRVLEAVVLAIGFFFFLRMGELEFMQWQDISIRDNRVHIVIRRQKTRSQLAPIPVSRACSAPVLVRIVRIALALKLTGPICKDVDVRAVLLKHLGSPPVLPGEPRALPWSLRCGGATACFAAGIDPAAIKRIGRWSSEVALLYCCVTPLTQDRLYGALAEANWWN